MLLIGVEEAEQSVDRELELSTLASVAFRLGLCPLRCGEKDEKL